MNEDTWGGSWGASWGESWGVTVAVIVTYGTSGAGSAGISGVIKRRGQPGWPERDRRHEEDDLLLCVIIQVVTMGMK